MHLFVCRKPCEYTANIILEREKDFPLLADFKEACKNSKNYQCTFRKYHFYFLAMSWDWTFKYSKCVSNVKTRTWKKGTYSSLSKAAKQASIVSGKEESMFSTQNVPEDWLKWASSRAGTVQYILYKCFNLTHMPKWIINSSVIFLTLCTLAKILFNRYGKITRNKMDM